MKTYTFLINDILMLIVIGDKEVDDSWSDHILIFFDAKGASGSIDYF